MVPVIVLKIKIARKRKPLMTENDAHNGEDRIAALIDQNLRRVYSDLVQEDLPDRFKDLLAVLKAQDKEETDRR